MTNLTPIVEALILILSAVISTFLIPWIRRKTTSENLKHLQAWTEIAVRAAEQLYQQCDGAEKREYVLNFLREHGYTIDPSIVNTVEAEVLKLHRELYGEWVA